MAYKDLIPYNEMSQWASDNGGPVKAMEMVEKTNQLIGERRGLQKGRIQGTGIGIAVVSSIIVVKKLWDMHKEKLEEEKFLGEQAKNAKEIIINEIKKENFRSSEVKEQGEADTP